MNEYNGEFFHNGIHKNENNKAWSKISSDEIEQKRNSRTLLNCDSNEIRGFYIWQHCKKIINNIYDNFIYRNT